MDILAMVIGIALGMVFLYFIFRGIVAVIAHLGDYLRKK